MKYLSYEEMIGLIDEKIPVIKEQKFDEIVAVVRGGLTAAHYLAKQLRLPVGVYYPSSSKRDDPKLILSNENSKKILFVEDLVAKGRTYRELKLFMRSKNPQLVWEFMPILIDEESDLSFNFYGFRASEWIVFPYEKEENIKEGDRGLFRFKTDKYGV